MLFALGQDEAAAREAAAQAAIEDEEKHTPMDLMMTMACHALLVVFNCVTCWLASQGQEGVPIASLDAVFTVVAHIGVMFIWPAHGQHIGVGCVGWLWCNPKSEGGKLMRATLLLIHMLTVGMVIFSNMMPCSDGSDRSCHDQRQLNAVFFSMVMISTVGYGYEIVPDAPLARGACIFYSMIGLFTFLIVGNALSSSLHAVRSLIFSAVARAFGGGAADDGCSTWEPPLLYMAGVKILAVYCQVFGLQFISAVIFERLEPEWTFQDAFYHCIMTATTIGFGDIGPQTQASRGFAIVHMLISVVCFSDLLTAFNDVIDLSQRAESKRELLRKRLDPKMILSLDKDGTGSVDKTEFVVGMLEALGLLDAGEARPFITQFELLDKDNSGSLDHADLQAAASRLEGEISQRHHAKLLLNDNLLLSRYGRGY